jgi:RIO kinase 1
MLAYFYRMELIVGEPMLVKSGKEATVYRCEAHPSTGLPYLAAKFYRPRQTRGFQNDAIYREGRLTGEHSIARAVRKKSRFGREVEFSLWKGEEYETLRLLHGAGLDVPRPIAYTDNLILMEYIGDDTMAAPPLQSVQLAPDEARAVFERLRWNIEAMLDCHRVHGDLSAYNILYWQGQARLIDFPQAIDPRANRNAHNLLWRDVANVCRYFADFGVHADPDDLTEGIWRRYSRARRYSYQ